MPFSTPPNIEITHKRFSGAQIGAGGNVLPASATLLPMAAFVVYRTNGTTGKSNPAEQLNLYGSNTGNTYFASDAVNALQTPSDFRMQLSLLGSDYPGGNPDLTEGLDFIGIATTGTLGDLDFYVVSAVIGG